MTRAERTTGSQPDRLPDGPAGEPYALRATSTARSLTGVSRSRS